MHQFQIAIKAGAAGMVIDGCIRDVDFLKENDFPVFAIGVTPRGPYKDGPGEINTDICCGGQVVHPWPKSWNVPPTGNPASRTNKS